MTKFHQSEVEAKQQLSGETAELEEWTTSATGDEDKMKVQID
jgi:hypothetical protein